MYSQSTTPSSFSVNSTTTNASQSPMLSNQKPRDYDASFAQLSSQYGFSGGLAAPSLSSPSSSRSASPSSSKNASRPSEAPELNRWDNAYAQLSNQYGFGSVVSAPSLPKSTRSKSSKRSCSPTPAPTSTKNAAKGQDLNRWELAYADLSGKYGFGASVPAPQPKKDSKAVEEDKRRVVVTLPSFSLRK